MLKCIGYVFIPILGVILILEIWRFIPFKDIPESEINDEVITQNYKDLNIADEDNGIFELEKINFANPYDNLVSKGEKLTDKQVEEVLKTNSEAMSLYQQALKKEYVIDPALLTMSESDVLTREKIFSLFSMYRFTAHLAENFGANPDALQIYEDAFSLTEKIYKDRANLIAVLQVLVLDNIMVKSVWDFSEEKTLTVEQLKQLSQAVLKQPDSSKSLASAFVYHYIVGKNTLLNYFGKDGHKNLLGEDVKFNAFSFQPNKTVQLGTDRWINLYEQNFVSCSQLKEIPKTEIFTLKNPWNLFLARYTPNGAGKLYASTVEADYDGYYAKKCYIDVSKRLTGTYLAIKAYHQENKSLPENLASLVPEFLAEVPEDNFSPNFAELQYHKEAQVLYSVGLNGTDDEGGDTFLNTIFATDFYEDTIKELDDLSFKLEFPVITEQSESAVPRGVKR